MQDLFRNYFSAAIESKKEENSELDNELNDYLNSQRAESEGQQNSEEEEEVDDGSEEESSDDDSEDSDIYARKDNKIKLVGSLNDF